MEAYLIDGSTKQVLCKLLPGRTSCEPGTIQEARTYYFELRNLPDPMSCTVMVDDLSLPEGPILAGENRYRWRWDVGFYAGDCDVEVRDESRKPLLRSRLITDPDSRKLTRAQFDDMVSDILEDSFALLSLSAHRVSIGRGKGLHRPPVARLELLWSRLNEIEAAVREIGRNPLRNMRTEQESLPFHRAGAVTPRELSRSFTTGQVRRASVPGLALPPVLQGLVPERISKRLKTTGLDTREHRDIKQALRLWSRWLSTVAGILRTTVGSGRATVQERKWAGRCTRMVRRIEVLLGLPLFADVQGKSGPLYVTSAYRRLPAYQRFYKAYKDFQSGIANVTSDYLALPIARTFDLYELWAYLRLVRAGSMLFPSVATVPETLISQQNGGLTVSAKPACVDFGTNVRICFQRTYQEFWSSSDKRGSFSRDMIPDVTMETSAVSGSPGCLIVLDAKYRIGSSLNEALSSLHSYRDALVTPVDTDPCDVSRIVTGAYLITPELLNAGTGTWANTAMPNRLFHPDYRNCFQFGAFAMVPGANISVFCDLLRDILADACSPTVGTTASPR